MTESRSVLEKYIRRFDRKICKLNNVFFERFYQVIISHDFQMNFFLHNCTDSF